MSFLSTKVYYFVNLNYLIDPNFQMCYSFQVLKNVKIFG